MLLGIPDQDLFRARAELIEEAYARQEMRVAHVDERLTEDAGEAAS